MLSPPPNPTRPGGEGDGERLFMSERGGWGGGGGGREPRVEPYVFALVRNGTARQAFFYTTVHTDDQSPSVLHDREQ